MLTITFPDATPIGGGNAPTDNADGDQHVSGIADTSRHHPREERITSVFSPKGETDRISPTPAAIPTAIEPGRTSHRPTGDRTSTREPILHSIQDTSSELRRLPSQDRRSATRNHHLIHTDGCAATASTLSVHVPEEGGLITATTVARDENARSTNGTGKVAETPQPVCPRMHENGRLWRAKPG